MTPKNTKLQEGTERKITKNKIGENVPQPGITELILVHCNGVNSQYLHGSRVFSTFVPSKSFGQLENISPKNHIYTEIQPRPQRIFSL